MALDHLGFSVSDFTKSRAFYIAALKPIGFSVKKETADSLMLGAGAGEPELWIGAASLAGPPPGHFHFAFTAPDHASVDAFHAAALAAGGRDNGGPGLRPQYHANYYAAFVIDPDGHNIEAVCHAPGQSGDQE
ncbi:VOC family protein [Plastoroseomonas arctica]|uniref:VOC family protein n=1 Tax=Plastoroseomonas arctica TaxID=1509237 RepID=A0AAF1KJX6_9PROT|nr:VOC family protein [Plastoroseomonas arctica]MBR0655995.1 VOC family protein [Plastoroseomonas arctica]